MLLLVLLLIPGLVGILLVASPPYVCSSGACVEGSCSGTLRVCSDVLLERCWPFEYAEEAVLGRLLDALTYADVCAGSLEIGVRFDADVDM